MKNNENTNNQQLLAEIVQLKQQVTQLEQKNQTFEAILNKAPILISVKDLEGNITVANTRFCELEHFCYDELVGHNIYELFPNDVADALWKDDLKALACNHLLEGEQSMTHTDGTKHNYYTVKYPISGPDDKVFGICSLSYDISEIKPALELSINDSLTGLYSRHYFNMCFKGELYHAKKNQHLFALMYLELDQFERFNDEFGTYRTEELLTTLATTLENTCVREHDLCFRLQNNRFACILTSDDEKDLEFIAEEILTYIESLSIAHPGNPPLKRVTVSIGYTVIHWQDDFQQDTICQQSKAALLQAKQQGGDKIGLFIKEK